MKLDIDELKLILIKCGVIVLTIEILLNITEAQRLWAEDKCMSMLHPILRKKS